MYHIVIEQTQEYKYRMEFDPIKNIFNESKFESLTHARNFPHSYGWIKESGTPPGSHLDVILLSSDKYKLGDEVAIKIVGVFIRNDGDNKLIAILPERIETDFVELSEVEKSDLSRLYPRVDEGEGWYGVTKAREIVENFFKTKRYKEITYSKDKIKLTKIFSGENGGS